MAKKPTLHYVCTNCGAMSSKWSGRCSNCGEWNSLQEEISIENDRTGKSSGSVLKGISIGEADKDNQPRLVTGVDEIDNLLGGGIVPGSMLLIAGQPGIGKSTLLLQLANAVAKQNDVLYVSGEESAHQLGLRAKRLGTHEKKLQISVSMITDDISSTIESGKFKLVIVDSIQTVICRALSSAPGTVTQISVSAQLMMSAAKTSNTAVIVVGHVTKEGSIAGPKVLEHMVDVVLQLDGDSYGGFKILRASKNRFGPTTEAGIFEMNEDGLKPVLNPSAALLAERQISDGSVVLATIEGTRPLLVEVQALVNPTSYGYPKRTASGIDINRVNVLVAVLERRTSLKLANHDIYINIVGGIRLSEPATDLAICMAIGSAARGLQLKNNAVVFGEVGLSGEIRHVPFIDKRLSEADKLGFDVAIGPIQKSDKKSPILSGVSDVRSALNKFLTKGQ
ncbi:MAG TPA: DNA repair protein RadA [Candidatus Saccharimonadales bacterium]|nr:DNA repair protein RadA [Candidatus Saccharimonadales bacterium]